MASKYVCFNDHICTWGVPLCPICQSTVIEVEEDTDTTESNSIYKISTSKQLIDLEAKNQILLKWLSQIQITNQDERKSCSDMLITARKALNDAKEKVAELTRPAKEEIDEIKRTFNPFIEKVDTGIKSITQAMSQWDFEQKRLQQEALTQAQSVNTDTGELSLEKPVPIISKTTQANVGSDTKIESFDIQITDANLIPRLYCDPSMVKLRAGFKFTDTIPGAIKVPKLIYQTRSKK